MKKLTAFLLAAVLVFSLCACGGNADPAAQTDNVDAVNNTTDAGTPITTPDNNADVTTSSLPVSENAEAEPAAASAGSYTLLADGTGGLELVLLTLKPNDDLHAASYRLFYADGSTLGTGEAIPVGESFRYLALMAPELRSLRAELYDSDDAYLCTVGFDTATRSLPVLTPGEGGERD